MVAYAGSYTACKHNAMPIKIDGKEYFIEGGSCLVDRHTVDVYVGLDDNFAHRDDAFPWKAQSRVFFPIKDHCVPKSKRELDSLADYLKEKIVAGKKVFIGCFGGHGRTGLVLAAMVKLYMGEEDAITYVRTNYCKQAVESKSQVDWLQKHYKIKVVKGSHEWASTGGSGGHARPYVFEHFDQKYTLFKDATVIISYEKLWHYGLPELLSSKEKVV
jgi:protein-tyrosine phosphatase